ncbi:hypothetical protein ACQEVB_01985 [Pseudonocardia sp. CA-107938]|uniref:hypothetical protein n=1 Tax=Pseudonocardia sp. CA-107938 TaxID=3240021 RepID=UPI003D94F299
MTPRPPTRTEAALLLAFVTVLSFVTTAVALVVLVVKPGNFLSVLPLLIAFYGVTAILFFTRREAIGGQDPAPPVVMGPADLAKAHGAARRRLATLRAEYAAFESDAVQVLRLPALVDVSVPSTARFVEDLAAALVLDAATPRSVAALREYTSAVDRARRSWVAAREAARRIRDTTLAPGEHAAVRRVLRLLDLAADNDNEAERRLAYTRALDELTKLSGSGTLNVPPAAMATLAARAQGESR